MSGRTARRTYPDLVRVGLNIPKGGLKRLRSHVKWWSDTPRLFAARHEFILEPDGEGTRLRHREYFSGVLVLILTKTLRRTEEGFHALNRALKERAEFSAGVRRVE